jgi:hypothetical protein
MQTIRTMSFNAMQTTLRLAAIYNLLWGAWVVLFPQHFFKVLGMAPTNYLMIWQGMGMVIGVYGVGYWLAAYNPLRHWPIVLVGLLGKIFGPIGFFINYWSGAVPFNFFYILLTNDFVWWVPFALIVRQGFKTGLK